MNKFSYISFHLGIYKKRGMLWRSRRVIVSVFFYDHSQPRESLQTRRCHRYFYYKLSFVFAVTFLIGPTSGEWKFTHHAFLFSDIGAKVMKMYRWLCYASPRHTRRRIDTATRERCGFLRSRRRTLRDLCPFYRRSDSGVRNSPVSLFDLASATAKLKLCAF